MAVVWSITNCEYTNDSDKGIGHAAWSATDTDSDNTGTGARMASDTPGPGDGVCVSWDSVEQATG